MIVLLSHNGTPVDLKLASRVTGLDVILGGHTHDALPKPIPVKSAGGTTWVTNAGSHGKFLAVLDLDIQPDGSGICVIACCRFFPTCWNRIRTCRR